MYLPVKGDYKYKARMIHQACIGWLPAVDQLCNIDITHTGFTLGLDMCEALNDYHAFSGCDSTRAFVGQGKVKGFKLLHDHNSFISIIWPNLANCCQSVTVADQVQLVLEPAGNYFLEMTKCLLVLLN